MQKKKKQHNQRQQGSRPGSRPGSRKRKWTGSHIKDLPYVEADVRDRRTNEVIRTRSCEELLSDFKRRVSKSGRLSDHVKRQHYTPPSEARRERVKNRRRRR